MIERIKLGGYRLLDEFEADLGKTTVVIGANATGKSTLLEALSLITHSLDWPLEDMLSWRYGIASILNRTRKNEELSWELTIAKPSHHPLWAGLPITADRRLVYSARLKGQKLGKIDIVEECLRYAKPFSSDYRAPLKLLDVHGARSMIYDASTHSLRPFNAPIAPSQQVRDNSVDEPPTPSELPPPKVSLLLNQMRFANEYPVPTWTRAYLSSFCYYTGFDVGRGSLVRTTMSEIKAQTTLSWNGDNLGNVLHEILTRHDYRDTANELRDFLAAAYPYIEDISAETAYGGEPRLLVRIREKGLLKSTEIWELSDGMLRFLLLCAALLNPFPPGLVAIDEPETGLHPKLLPIVADMIRAASERSQVLVTTHSPELLNRFALDEVRVLARKNGHAHWFRPSDRPSLHKMLESELGGTIGELHVSGELEALQ